MYLTPCLHKKSMNPLRPPGLSSTRTVSLTNLPSAARPRSRHLPNNVVSILPPDSNTTTLKENKINIFSTNDHSLAGKLVLDRQTDRQIVTIPGEG